MSRKLLLFITDAGFHFAGDGKVKMETIMLDYLVLIEYSLYALPHPYPELYAYFSVFCIYIYS